MVRSVLICCLLSISTLCAIPRGAGAEEEVLDGIAAVVNGDVITFSQIRDMVGSREKALHDQFKGQELVEKIKQLRLAAVKELVDQQLIIQEFKKNKFSIPDYVIDDHIQSLIREQFGGDRNAFVRTLEAQGYTLERFKQIETDKIIVQAMRSKQIKSDIMIPPQQIEDFYRKNVVEYSTPDQVKLRMIVVKKNGENGLQMAKEIRQKAVAGGSFENLAQMYSEDGTKDAGGDWGWIDRKTLNETLSKIAFSLKPGQVSQVVELGGNYYILYVESKKNGVTKSLAEVHDDIENKLLQIERQNRMEKWIASLRQKAYIKMF